MSDQVITATRGMLLILNAASLRRLPMPFHAGATNYEPVVTLQFHLRVDVMTWAAALDVAEVTDDPTDDGGTAVVTTVLTTWPNVPLRLCASIPREPR